MKNILDDLKAQVTGNRVQDHMTQRPVLVTSECEFKPVGFQSLEEFRVDVRLGGIVTGHRRDKEKIREKMFKVLRHEIYSDIVGLIHRANVAAYNNNNQEVIELLSEIMDITGD